MSLQPEPGQVVDGAISKPEAPANPPAAEGEVRIARNDGLAGECGSGRGSPSRGRRYRGGLLVMLVLAFVGGASFRSGEFAGDCRRRRLTAKADRQHQKNGVPLEGGARDDVTDRHGKVLAMNMDVPSVFGVPSRAREVPLRRRAISRRFCM
jgi:hypothetical protein